MKLYQNAVFNVLGGVLPAIASLLTVPVIMGRLGNDQFGLFTLITSIVGYFAVVDINVTAGSVKYLAQHHSQGDHVKSGQVFSFGALIYVAVGLLGAGGLWCFAPMLVEQIFKVPPALHTLGVEALQVAAWGFLFTQVQVYLLSVPQALQRYDVAGRFEGIFGTLVSALTVVVVVMGGGLSEVLWARAALSVLNCLALLRAIRVIYPQMQCRQPTREVMSGVASFSAYAYLSRLATITFLHADNLLIGAMLSVTQVPLFSVPFQLANRALGIVNRASAVLFPTTSALAAQAQWEALRTAYLGATRYVVYLNSCMLVLLMVGARELLHYYLRNDAFDQTAAFILIVLALSVFIDSLTIIPSLVNDGLGAPRNTGLFALARGALGLVGAWVGIVFNGVVGAAVSQLLVTVVSTVAFVVTIHHLHRDRLAVSVRTVVSQAWSPSLVVVLVAGAWAWADHDRQPLSIPAFAMLMFASGMACAAWGWWRVLLPQDRVRLTAWWQARMARPGVGLPPRSKEP